MLKNLFRQSTKAQTEDDLGFWLDVPKTKPQKRKSTRKTRTSRVAALTAVLEELNRHNGEEVTASELAHNLGYNNPAIVTRYLQELIDRGTITRIGTKRHYSYRVNRQRVNARKSVTKTPRVSRKSDNTRQRVFRYISDHQGEFLTLSNMAQALNVSTATISYKVKDLVDAGKLEVSEATYDGRRFRVPGNVKVPDNHEAPNAQVVRIPMRQSNDQVLTGRVEELIWEYLKDVGNTDILGFIQWLKKRK